MPSANEAMIANQAMGKMYEITAPYNPSSIEGLNNTIDYLGPQRITYGGKSLPKPAAKPSDLYVKDTVLGMQKQNMYTSAAKSQQQDLYSSSMMGMYH